jgi:hypothetical protein
LPPAEGCGGRTPDDERGTGLAERLLGLDGFRMLEVTQGPDELVVTVETTAEVVGRSAVGCVPGGARSDAIA